MIGLTAKQRRCLDFIKESIAKRGFPPSNRELCVYLGVKSTNAVHGRYLRALQKKGYIAITANISRGIRVIKRPFVFIAPERRDTGEIFFPSPSPPAEVA